MSVGGKKCVLRGSSSGLEFERSFSSPCKNRLICAARTISGSWLNRGVATEKCAGLFRGVLKSMTGCIVTNFAMRLHSSIRNLGLLYKSQWRVQRTTQDTSLLNAVWEQMATIAFTHEVFFLLSTLSLCFFFPLLARLLPCPSGCCTWELRLPTQLSKLSGTDKILQDVLLCT